MCDWKEVHDKPNVKIFLLRRRNLTINQHHIFAVIVEVTDCEADPRENGSAKQQSII